MAKIKNTRASDHFVDTQPFDPYAIEKLTPEQEKFYRASGWSIMWMKFRKNRLAVVSGFFILALYLSLPIMEFLAPYTLDNRNNKFIYAPPQGIHLFHEGGFVGPFVYGYKSEMDMATFQRVYKTNTQDVQPLRFFCSGDDYTMLGFIKSNKHLVCAAEGGTFFIFGTDRLGRDLQSRMMYGARISLTIGLIGVAISFVLGLFFGGIAGYFGGWVDSIIQRTIEILKSIPEIPLWLALSAAIPQTWSPMLVFLGITVILGFLDWPGLARAVRSKLLALREEDYVRAAELMGASPKRIIGKHLLPNFISHLIASLSLSIPAMILGETALSYLGLGLRPPVTSWGVLLNESLKLEFITIYPWLLLPMLPVVMVVLAFNFLGDGLRDAADPYA